MQDSWLARKATGTDSGFSEEDLVSNLIAFYRTVYPVIDVDALCKPVSVKASQEVWRVHGAVGQNENKAFTPHLYACSECPGAQVLPPQFQTITPATKGVWFDDWAPPPVYPAPF